MKELQTADPETKSHLTRRIASGLFALTPVMGVAACGDSDPGVDQATLGPIEKSFNLNLEPYTWGSSTTFKVGDRKVTIISEDGAEDSSFSDERISEDVHDSLRLKDEGEQVVRISMPGDHLDVAFTIEPAQYTTHDYIILSDPSEVAELVGQQIPGAVTLINLDKETASTGEEALTLLAHYDQNGGDSLRFGDGRLNIDVYNLAVETCNNLTDVKLTDETTQELLKLSGSEEKLAQTMPGFVKLLKESACNSFAAIVAAKDAGYSYAEYTELMKGITLGNTASFGFTVPYIQYSETYWESL